MTTQPAALITALPDLAVIDVRGTDAASFLHGQLTQDMTGLPAGHARLAGYCSPKGRLLATLVAWRTDAPDAPGLRLLVRQDLVDALLRRLRMFVLRAQVQLLPADQAVVGVTSGHTDVTTLPWSPAAPPDAAPWAVTTLPQGVAIAAPSAADQVGRWWWLPAADAPMDSQPTGLAQWHAADMAAGLGWISAAVADTFLPQSLNLDLIDGLRFDKGCYPGQEVVARAHYRHAVKRRMAYAIAPGGQASMTTAGGDVYRAGESGLACGRVIDAAQVTGADGDLSTHVLVELALAAWHADDLRLGAADGLPLSRQPLPYPVPGTDA